MLSLFSKHKVLDDNYLELLINTKFSHINKELLKLNFSLYISQRNNPDAFIINLDDIYLWLGFGRKDTAKKLLINKFIRDKDYSILTNRIQVGRPCETILLTVKAFKKFSLLASTKESEQIYDYYIELENIINEYLNKKYIESNLIIQNQVKIIRDNGLLINQLKLLNRHGFVYVMSTDIKGIYKCGRTINIPNRVLSLQTALVDKIEILYYFETKNNVLLESIIHINFETSTGKYIVIDGNHRREALILLSREGIYIDVICCVYKQLDEDALIHKFNIINEHLPIAQIYMKVVKENGKKEQNMNRVKIIENVPN